MHDFPLPNTEYILGRLINLRMVVLDVHGDAALETQVSGFGCKRREASQVFRI
jgi:hypothetical protein